MIKQPQLALRNSSASSSVVVVRLGRMIGARKEEMNPLSLNSIRLAQKEKLVMPLVGDEQSTRSLNHKEWLLHAVTNGVSFAFCATNAKSRARCAPHQLMEPLERLKAIAVAA